VRDKLSKKKSKGEIIASLAGIIFDVKKEHLSLRKKIVPNYWEAETSRKEKRDYEND
jgi:hypothetical protein